LEGQGFGTILNFGGASVTNALTINGSNACLKNFKAVISAGAGGAGTRPNIVFNMWDSYILIEHLWLIGDKTVANDGSLERQNGILIRTTNSKVINCIVEDNVQCSIQVVTGIRNDISGNFCKDSTIDGILLRVASVGNVLVHNVCESNGKCGIECFALAKMNTITANRCYDNYYGISLRNCYKQVLSSNVCTDCAAAGINLDATSPENQISANQCSDNGRGIKIFSSRNNITGNVCVDNNNDGIFLHRASYCTITGNASYSSVYGDGITVIGDATTNADYNTITGNVCYDNGDDGIAIEGAGDANKNIVLGNQLTGNSGTAFVDNGTATQIGHNITA